MEQSARTYNTKTWVDPRVIVKNSTIEGQGGFAAEPIKKGEIVIVLGGTPMTQHEFEVFTATASSYDAVQIDEDLHLVDLSPESRAENGSLNHSCDSNLWMRDEVTIVARRDIPRGEELNIDYALFTNAPNWVLDKPCRCQSLLCRQQITGNDWQIPDVQQRYRGHFSPFINRRIANSQR
ncbi:MAG: SET domain-containing protein-lysine N-methyltransferase [Chloroflexi bacterium]|nr:SET domain-containing protein-lysine N-methyltransferase [Chloroflexota bacterium]